MALFSLGINLMSTINEDWSRVEAWLQANDRAALDSLNPPATTEEIATLAQAIGAELPPELVAVYQVHNGQDEECDASGLFPIGEDFGDMAHGFAPIETALNIHEMMCELLESGDVEAGEETEHRSIKTAGWNRLWVPVAHDGGGDYHCVDLDPGPEGAVGQVITAGEGDQIVVAESLGAWLKTLADDMDRGMVSVDEEYGLFRECDEAE